MSPKGKRVRVEGTRFMVSGSKGTRVRVRVPKGTQVRVRSSKVTRVALIKIQCLILTYSS